MPGMEISRSALDAFGVGMEVIANNVANMNTDGFRASRTRYQEAPRGGVEIQEIRRTANEAAEAAANAATDLRAADVREAEERDADARAVEARETEARAASNTQVEREFTEAVITEQAYAANAAMLRTYDDMLGTVVDMVV